MWGHFSCKCGILHTEEPRTGGKRLVTLYNGRPGGARLPGLHRMARAAKHNTPPPKKQGGTKKGARHKIPTPCKPCTGCRAAGRVRRNGKQRRLCCCRPEHRQCPERRKQPEHPGAYRSKRARHRPVRAGKERAERVGGRCGAALFRPCAQAGMH